MMKKPHVPSGAKHPERRQGKPPGETGINKGMKPAKVAQKPVRDTRSAMNQRQRAS